MGTFARPRLGGGQTRPVALCCSTPRVASDLGVVFASNKWRVRPINKDNRNEIRTVSQLQAQGFHVPNAIPLINDLLLKSFAAEVLSEMHKKLKYNPEDIFVCLVVEDTLSHSVIGVGEVSHLCEKEVLKSLEPGMTKFVYLSSMTIAPSHRRSGAANALVQAATKIAHFWGEDQLVLHVFQDNEPAINLYTRAGFSTIYEDAPWLKHLAMRPRFLMRKYL